MCAQVNAFDLIELDALMGDPSAWPASVWGNVFEKPQGDLPAAYRRFGAIEMGVEWLARHDYLELDRGDVRRHYRYDVPKIATTPADLVATGLIARGNARTTIAKLNPLAYLTYYNTGIEVGIEGLNLLMDRIETLKKENKEVPIALVKMALDAGGKLAMSQAAIKAQGRPFGQDDDADDGFRTGAGDAPSTRMGHHRIRTVEGESRPIRDTGPADRAAYNERARQEGSPELPSS